MPQTPLGDRPFGDVLALPALKNNPRKIKEPPSTESTLRACSLSSRGDHPNLEASKRGNESATCFALVYFEVSRETWKVTGRWNQLENTLLIATRNTRNFKPAILVEWKATLERSDLKSENIGFRLNCLVTRPFLLWGNLMSL